jgi:hypothetical protein
MAGLKTSQEKHIYCPSLVNDVRQGQRSGQATGQHTKQGQQGEQLVIFTHNNHDSPSRRSLTITTIEAMKKIYSEDTRIHGVRQMLNIDCTEPTIQT